MDFTGIKLTSKERKILKAGQEQYVIPAYNVERLLRLKLAEEEFSGLPGYQPKPTGRICTTSLGRDYLQYYRIAFRERWLPYWMTTGLSILAIIISGIALLSELGLLQLPTP